MGEILLCNHTSHKDEELIKCTQCNGVNSGQCGKCHGYGDIHISSTTVKDALQKLFINSDDRKIPHVKTIVHDIITSHNIPDDQELLYPVGLNGEIKLKKTGNTTIITYKIHNRDSDTVSWKAYSIDDIDPEDKQYIQNRLRTIIEEGGSTPNSKQGTGRTDTYAAYSSSDNQTNELVEVSGIIDGRHKQIQEEMLGWNTYISSIKNNDTDRATSCASYNLLSDQSKFALDHVSGLMLTNQSEETVGASLQYIETLIHDKNERTLLKHIITAYIHPQSITFIKLGDLEQEITHEKRELEQYIDNINKNTGSSALHIYYLYEEYETLQSAVTCILESHATDQTKIIEIQHKIDTYRDIIDDLQLRYIDTYV